MSAPATSGTAARRAGPRTVLELLRRATGFLEAKGGATPRLDAELLLATVLDTDRVGVYLRFDQPLASGETDAYRTLIRRRAAGTPVAYLTGEREFWSQALAVTPAVLIPRPETEVVVERALAAVGRNGHPVRILDLGAGSGAIGIALARELPAATVVAVDLSPAAARVARANAERAGVGGRLACVVGDWASALAPSARFDLVVSNPPYVATAALDGLPDEVRAEPPLALDGGADGLDAHRRLIPMAAALLAADGRLAVEIGEAQAEPVAAMLRAAGLVRVEVHPDLADVPRVVVGVRAGGEGG